MAYQTEVLADAPRGYWRMEDAWAGIPGTYPVLDSSGNGHNASGYGGAPVAGKVGSAFRFVRQTLTGITVGASDLMGTGFATMAVECWVKTSSPDNGQILVAARSFSGATGNNNYELRFQSGKIRAGFYCSSGYAEPDTVASYNDGQWHHVVGVYDGAKVLIYVDGASVPLSGNSTLVGGVVNSGGGSSLRICSYVIDGMGVDATIDEVAIYGGSTALSAARVQAHYDAATQIIGGPVAFTRTRTVEVVNDYPRAVIDDGAVAYYRFEDLAGSTTATDEIAGRTAALSEFARVGIPGALGNGLEVFYPDSYLTAPGPWQPRLGQTVEIVMYLPGSVVSLVNGRTVACQWDTVLRRFRLHVTPAGTIALGLMPASGSEYGLVTPVQVADSIWHHVVFTLDAAGTTAWLYVDGERVTGGTMLSPLVQPGAMPMLAGRGFTSDGSVDIGRSLAGAVDELAVYDIELTPLQVRQHYVLLHPPVWQMVSVPMGSGGVPRLSMDPPDVTIVADHVDVNPAIVMLDVVDPDYRATDKMVEAPFALVTLSVEPPTPEETITTSVTCAISVVVPAWTGGILTPEIEADAEIIACALSVLVPVYKVAPLPVSHGGIYCVITLEPPAVQGIPPVAPGRRGWGLTP